MIPATTLAKLAVLGLSAEQAEAVAVMLRDVEEATKDELGTALEARRANDRERKARQRHVKSREVTGQSGTKESVSPTPPSKENHPPQKKTPLTGGQKKRGARLSEDWALDEAGRAYALAQGVPAAKVEPMAARFKNHWLSKAGKDGAKLDWAATWRNWVLSDCERYGWAPTATGPPEKPPDPDALRPPGAPTSAELRARYAAATKATDDREDADPEVLREGPGVHRPGEAGRPGPVRGHQAGNGRVEQLGDLFPAHLRLVAGGHA